MKKKTILTTFCIQTTVLFANYAQNNFNGTIKTSGSGAYNNNAATAIVFENNVANSQWQWHALDDGNFQLADRLANKNILFMNSSGHVGIGTITPTHKLTISGSGAYNNSEASSIILENSVANKRWQLHALDDGGLQFGDYNISTTRFLINSDGNVGIGTITPTHKLTISGKGTYNNSRAASFILENSVANKRWQLHALDNGDIQFCDYNTGATRFLINSGGNVGIGTINPGAFKLAVNGHIRAKEIKVETGWSDFVFEDDYNLLSLKDVEQFIKDNRHLPDIPSAKEVEENGVNVGKMESKLLQKIEELTLYIIQQEKRIEQLENKVKN